MVQMIMAITLCYPVMWRVTTGYVAVLNTEQNCSTINGAKGRPEKICSNTTRLTNVARFGIHWIFKLGLVAKNSFFFNMQPGGNKHD